MILHNMLVLLRLSGVDAGGRRISFESVVEEFSTDLPPVTETEPSPRTKEADVL